jgi:thioredoxin 1
MGPVIEELAGEYAGKAKIAKLDVDSHQAMAGQFGIRGIPTMLIFKNGQIVDQAVGAVPKDVLVQKLDAQIAA